MRDGWVVVYEKGEDNMIPVIDKKKTGIHLRRIMDGRGLSVIRAYFFPI